MSCPILDANRTLIRLARNARFWQISRIVIEHFVRPWFIDAVDPCCGGCLSESQRRNPLTCSDHRTGGTTVSFSSKYMTAAVAKIVLATRTLRWSSPILFNDPFDVTQELRLDFDAAKLNACLTDELASRIENGEPLDNIPHPMAAILFPILMSASPELRQKVANGLRDELSVTTSGQVGALSLLKETWAKMVPTFRILCLSEVPDSAPMWAHYTDQHRGVVLEFSAVDELDSAFLTARPVVYQDDAPSIADTKQWVNCILGLGEVNYLDLFAEYQYVKTKGWEYEKEWRIVSSARPGDHELFHDYEFHPDELTGIYFGYRCSEDDRAELMALLTSGLEHTRP